MINKRQLTLIYCESAKLNEVKEVCRRISVQGREVKRNGGEERGERSVRKMEK